MSSWRVQGYRLILISHPFHLLIPCPPPAGLDDTSAQEAPGSGPAQGLGGQEAEEVKSRL